MNHDTISVDDVQSFRDSIMDLIDYTPAMVADELKNALHASGVDEGVRGSIHCFSQIVDGGIPFAYCIVDVAPLAMVEWTQRIEQCESLLRGKPGFHVEHSTRPQWHRDLTQFTISVRYERPRPV